MRTLTARWIMPALLLSAVTAYGAKPTTCSPSPVRVTIADDAGNRIKSDGKGAYVNGVDGVQAIIYDCPGQSGDMTLSTGTGSRRSAPVRSIQFDFTDTVFTTSTTPSWLGAPFSINFLNIWRVMYNYNASGTYPFTTGAGGAGFPDSNYYLRFQNPLRDPSPVTDLNVNTPCNTALINVTHYPKVGATPETWIVSSDPAASMCALPNPIHVGSVMNGKTGSNAGQARLPFRLTIEKLN